MAIAGPLVGRGGLSQTWSLAVEEQFYLTLPLVVRYASRRRLVRIVAAFIAASVILRVLVALYAPTQMYGTYLLTPCRADALGLGVLAAVAARDRKLWLHLREHRVWLYTAAGAFLLVLLLIDLSSFESFSATLYGMEYLVLAGFYACLLLVAITGKDWFVKIVLCNQPLIRLGTIAYGTYLFHRCTIRIAHLLMGSSAGAHSTAFFVAPMIIGVAGAIFAAQLSWTFFEKPLVRRGHRNVYTKSFCS